MGELSNIEERKIVVSCKCGNTNQFARTALKMIRPKAYNEIEEYFGKQAISAFADKLLYDSNLKSKLRGIAKSEEPFAYYIEYSIKHNTAERSVPKIDVMYDLLTGRRVE